jgi:hypothetical protein
LSFVSSRETLPGGSGQASVANPVLGANTIREVPELLRHFSAAVSWDDPMPTRVHYLRRVLPEYGEHIARPEVQNHIAFLVKELLKSLAHPKKNVPAHNRLKVILPHFGPNEESRRELISANLPPLEKEDLIFFVGSGIRANQFVDHRRSELASQTMDAIGFYSAWMPKLTGEMPPLVRSHIRSLLHNGVYPPIQLAIYGAMAGFLDPNDARKTVDLQLRQYIHTKGNQVGYVSDALRHTLSKGTMARLYDADLRARALRRDGQYPNVSKPKAKPVVTALRPGQLRLDQALERQYL